MKFIGGGDWVKDEMIRAVGDAIAMFGVCCEGMRLTVSTLHYTFLCQY